MRQETLDRLLLAKSYLDRTRFQQVNAAAATSVADHVLAAHDAAELGIAAICHELDCLPNKKEFSSYFDELAKTTGNAVKYRGYMMTLNNVRVALKHFGVRPDSKQWANVSQTTYEYIADWCTDYLQVNYDELDRSFLIVDPDVRQAIQHAKDSIERGLYKEALEQIATALMVAFNKCSALSSFEAGKADAEQALRIAGFGVPANDFLSLQHLLPHRDSAGKNSPQWKQSQYGHPGNWSVLSAEFCLKTALDVMVKIQDADWIPGPILRDTLYEKEIEALEDGVEIYQYRTKTKPGEQPRQSFWGIGSEVEKVIVRTLKKGEKLRVFHVSLLEIESLRSADPLAGLASALAGKQKSKEEISVAAVGLFGQVNLSKVKVMCVPRDEPWIRQFYDWLPSFEWDPE